MNVGSEGISHSLQIPPHFLAFPVEVMVWLLGTNQGSGIKSDQATLRQLDCYSCQGNWHGEGEALAVVTW